MNTEHAVTVIAVHQLVQRFFCLLDESDYDALLAQFRADATWERQGALLSSRDAMRAALAQRSPTQHIRHVITNVVVEPDKDGREAGVTAYMTAYRHDDGQQSPAPHTIAGPFRLSLVSGRACRQDDTWRFAELSIRPAFEFTQP